MKTSAMKSKLITKMHPATLVRKTQENGRKLNSALKNMGWFKNQLSSQLELSGAEEAALERDFASIAETEARNWPSSGLHRDHKFTPFH